MITPPPPTGDKRFDALLAGLVEHHLTRRRLPEPPWVSEPQRRLEQVWDVAGLGDHDLVPELARHGVALSPTELSTV